MAQPNVLTVWVIDSSQNNAEALASALRNAGYRLQLSLLSRKKDVREALEQASPDLVLAASDHENPDPATAVSLLEEAGVGAPVIGVADNLDPEAIAAAHDAGARDLVSRSGVEHLQRVVARELKVVRQWLQLQEAERSADEARARTASFLNVTSDAVAYATEGIHAEVNDVYARLFGFDLPAQVEGLPVMDFVSEDDREAMKKRLRGFEQGKVDTEPFSVTGVRADGTTFPAEIYLSEVHHEGERALQIMIPAQGASAEAANEYEQLRERYASLERKYQLLTVEHAKLRRREAAVRTGRENEASADASQEVEEIEQNVSDQEASAQADQRAGLPDRASFLNTLGEKLANTDQENTSLLYVILDGYDDLVEELGFTAADQGVTQAAEVIARHLEPDDLAARVEDDSLGLLIRRSEKDRSTVVEWAQSLTEAIGQTVFDFGDQSRTLTCSVGVREIPGGTSDAEALLLDARRAARHAVSQGGDSVRRFQPSMAASGGSKDDARLAAETLRKALQEDRLQVVHQPIAALDGSPSTRFSVRTRVVDENGQEHSFQSYTEPAREAGLMSAVDQWVVEKTATLAEAGRNARAGAHLFIKLSSQTLADPDATEWLEPPLERLRACGVSIFFEIDQEEIEKHIKAGRHLAQAMGKLGSGIVLDQFGVRRDALRLLDQLPVHYVKLDSSFTTELAGDEDKQQRFREIVDKATEKGIHSIAAQVEDAHTLAVLWQLGVNYIQGNYVQEPEVVLSSQTPGEAAAEQSG